MCVCVCVCTLGVRARASAVDGSLRAGAQAMAQLEEWGSVLATNTTPAGFKYFPRYMEPQVRGVGACESEFHCEQQRGGKTQRILSGGALVWS